MRDLESITAKQILSVRTPEALFSQSRAQAKAEYRALIRLWHPDFRKTSIAPEVLAHLVSLYKIAKHKSLHGDWHEPCLKVEQEQAGVKTIRMKDGSIKRFRYLAASKIELGCMYIADNYVVFQVDAQYEDLYRRARKTVRGLSFSDADMACEIAPCLPEIVDCFSSTKSNFIAFRKTPDQLLLKDICAHMGGAISPVEHVGWILNVLYNIACYLEVSGIVHNGISVDTLFVSPLRHSGMLLGGWWYSLRFEEEMLALPEDLVRFIPPDIVSNGLACQRADLELIKATGRALLGYCDSDWESLRFDCRIPASMLEWLLLPSTGSAVEDYAVWKYEVLPQCFGRPAFVDLRLVSGDLYKEG
ncbi:MAG: hypothetical protein K8F91_08880 [Candidatus Obscuribacterales bacterium]|nr:hypothetical protein [Candidatus Obscuribacterales bacterium]